MSIWFISDTHFGHKNVIKYCDRPFSSVEEMDEVLFRNWEETVSREDTVYHLGDIAFGPAEEKEVYYRRVAAFPFETLVIRGNHDESVKKMEDCGLHLLNSNYSPIKLTKYKLILSHKPMPDANIPEGYVNIHGHTHNSILDDSYDKSKHYCVCVELHDYKPVSLEKILEDIKRKDDSNG